MKVFCVVLIVVAAAGESLAHESHEAEYAPLYAHPSYSFSYGVKDSHSGDVKSQWETRDNGVIKGHYSVVEPDGSIREVDYTADSKNGFNAVVKTHGPNEHPIVDEHGHTKYGGKHAQSKINHYSKDQDTLILSSDVPINEPGVAEINEKTRHSPSILELKPNVHLGAPPQGHGHGHGNSHSYTQSHSHGHSQSHTPSHGHSYSEQSNQSYQPLKFRPQAEIKEHQPSYMTHHSGQSGSSSFTSQGDVIVGTHSGGFKPSAQITKPKTVIKLKKQEVKKVKLITPGLKHYANVPKFVARNDYNNYFRSRSAMEEQRDASHRLVQGLYRRSPRTLLVPQYAPDALNYHF